MPRARSSDRPPAGGGRPSQYRPYLPLDVLKPVGDGLWIVDGPEIVFKAAGLGMGFPTRMTVARLADGDLWLHSPVQPTDELMAAIAALGPVKFLIAPNSLHYWWIPDWQARFPSATVFTAPGLRQSAKRRLPEGPTLDGTVPPAWEGQIDQLPVSGGWFHEVEFFHRPSKTLILVDLIENFELDRVRPTLLQWLLRLAGSADPDGKAPLDMRLQFWRHRQSLKVAVERMLGYHPERVILAHGRWYDRNGEAELRRAFRWVL